MKSYELKPTYENIFETYKNDTISRNEDVFHFTTILNAVEDGCSIALDGNWGSGKTFFVKQVKMVLDAHNCHITAGAAENEDHRKEIVDIRTRYYGNNAIELLPQVCVYYDAWENDNDDDPVLSLVYTILNSVENDFTFRSTDYIKTGANIMEMFTNKSWTQLIETLKGTSPLDALKERKDIEKLVGKFLEELLPEKGNRLIVFIDELDRCKPNYAVQLLERIKHYFTHDNITFVFSVNTNELQHTIRKHYGENFDGSRYLDRFFDLRVSLPPPNLEKYYESIRFYDKNHYFDMICKAVIEAYNFQLREIAKYIRLTRIAVYKPIYKTESEFIFSEQRGIKFCMMYVIPIMIGLKIKNEDKYRDFIEGRDHTALTDISDMIYTHFFQQLLTQEETYNDSDKTKKLVRVNAKLKDVYNAVFVTAYNAEMENKTIGELTFNKWTKNQTLKISSLLSKYTKTDMD